ncbi:MAG: universal stress protein [Rhodobacteraceae bacterium]|nr:MAG: universal stress protein [Paracoccaceae bacterium]
MYKKVLMPLAYRPGHHPDKELRAAKAIAAPGAHVTLLHVIGAVPEFRSDETVTKEALAKVIAHDLERVADTFVDAEVMVVEGEPSETILDLASSKGIDCIVLAPHRSDTGEYGSTAAQVVRRAPCTVHLVR